MRVASESLFAAVEGGGTNFNCALYTASGEKVAQTRVPTGAPVDTIAQCVDFFERHIAGANLAAAGLACFGPLELSPESGRCGEILDTPKPGWTGFNPRTALHAALRVPVAVDLDVAGSARGEQAGGIAQGVENFVYITVGTGIGAACVVGGEMLRGASHPELGHIRVPRVRGDDFPGSCPFHGDCLSGLASGAALRERCSGSPESVPPDDPLWEIEATYLSELCVTAIYAYAPQLIVLAGGVMEVPGLRETVVRRTGERLAGYHCADMTDDRGVARIVAPGLGAQSGIVGALQLARMAVAES